MILRYILLLVLVIPQVLFSTTINSDFIFNNFSTITNQNVKIIDISIKVEDAFLGGKKILCSATIKNNSEEDVNYTLYVLAVDSQNNMICTFSLEPDFNIHEAETTETLIGSGLIDINSNSSIKKIITKFIVQ